MEKKKIIMIYIDKFPVQNPWEQMDKNIKDNYSDKFVVLQDPENSLFSVGDELEEIGVIPRTLELHTFDTKKGMYKFIDKRMMNDYTKVYIDGEYESKIISKLRG